MPSPMPLPPPKRARRATNPDLGTIVMATSNADISVDGVYVGHSPLRHFIAAGAHRVTLFDTNTFRRASFQISVSNGHATPIDFPAK